MSQLKVVYCTGGCMQDLNAPGAPERSGVNGLCEDCFEREEQAREARADVAHDRAMERWARRYDDLNGAPEGPEDR